MENVPKGPAGNPRQTAKGWPRSFLGNQHIYATISQRAHGLSIGVNFNPKRVCNFDCVYCEVELEDAKLESPVDIDIMSAELVQMLDLAAKDKLRDLPQFGKIPADLLRLKEVAISGNGEPTLCPNFDAALEAVLRVRSQQRHFFKIVLISNSTGLFLPHVRRGWRQLAAEDEIWLKLEAGTQKYMDRVNQPTDATLQNVMANILRIGRERTIVIQSLFPMLGNEEPGSGEIDAYIHRLQELMAGGAQISMVQIYSAHRPAQNPNCHHLPLSTLSAIAKCVREQTRLRAEVY